MDVKVKVIKKFNEDLGFKLDNLKEIDTLHSKLEQNKNKVEESLSLASSEAPSVIQEAVEEVSEITNCINQIKRDCELTYNDIDERLQQENKTSELQAIMEDISYLEKSSSYLQFVKFIEDLSSELEVSLLGGNDEACISSYVILKETYQNLESSSCTHLKNYVKNTLQFWFDQIQMKLVGEYADTLKAIKWPFCGVNVNVQGTISQESLAKFKILTEHLFHLQLPYSDSTTKPTSSGVSASFEPLCLPVYFLLEPLRIRFNFHFSGTKQTNRRDKPEWFFTQILTWIKEHSEWLEKNVQTVANTAGFSDVKVKVEFMRGLVQLAVIKLDEELKIVQYDDVLFAHTVDEALGFERELRDTLLYPPSEPATVFVLTQAHIFMKWITMEKKYAIEKMDAVLSSETAWSRLMEIDIDEMKITECADAFLTLLYTMSDRYNLLPQPGHRLQFLDLQLELIDDWRVRLLQLLHQDYVDPLKSMIPSILNTLHYVSTVLQDWGVTVPFLKLYYFKKQFENVEISTHGDSLLDSILEDGDKDVTVFDEAVSLLQRLEEKLITEIGDSVFEEIKSKSRMYCGEKWFTMPSEKEIAFLSVTPSSCPMFQQLVKKLHDLHSELALPLFEKSWKKLAIRLDEHLFEELVLKNKFNDGGAAQFQFDVKRNLFPVFAIYTSKPESYFCLLIEACTLLNMLVGTAMLLKEVLELKGGASEKEKLEKLADVDVHQLSPETALRLLTARMDMSTR